VVVNISASIFFFIKIADLDKNCGSQYFY